MRPQSYKSWYPRHRVYMVPLKRTEAWTLWMRLHSLWDGTVCMYSQNCTTVSRRVWGLLVLYFFIMYVTLTHKYTHTRTHACMHAHQHTYAYTHACTCVCVCACVCVCVCVSMCVCRCVCRMCTYSWLCLCMHMAE